MREYKHELPVQGDDLDRRAKAILGSKEYGAAEYLEALGKAEEVAVTATSVEELAERILGEDESVRTLDAARVLARLRLGLLDETRDPIQVAAERLARERGTSLDAIRDYRELSQLYQDAERFVQGTWGRGSIN